MLEERRIFLKLKLVLYVFILMIGIPAENDACLSQLLEMWKFNRFTLEEPTTDFVGYRAT